MILKSGHSFIAAKIFLSLTACFTGSKALSQIDTVKIGTYVLSLHGFNLADNTFKCDAYYWCLYKNRNFNFQNEFEIMNTNEVNYEGTNKDTIKSYFWFFTKVKAVIRKNWEKTNFPFDQQLLRIKVESSENDLNSLVFTPDEKNSELSDTFLSQNDEWKIISSRFYTDITRYNSNFGNQFSGNESFNSSFNTEIVIKRKDSVLILFKLITGLIISFLISVCVFFIKPIDIDPRFGLCVGGIFAAIGNKYIVDNIVPSTNKFNLLDDLHTLTFFYIFLIVIMSIISLNIYEKGTQRSKKNALLLDRVSFFVIILSYPLIITSIVFNHIF